MPRTRQWEFLVVECNENHLSFRVIGGNDSGREVSIPKEHPEYPQEIEEKLCSDVKTGTVIEASLVTEPEATDDWRVKDLHSCRRP